MAKQQAIKLNAPAAIKAENKSGAQWALDNQLIICATILVTIHAFDLFIPIEYVISLTPFELITYKPKALIHAMAHLSYHNSEGTYSTGSNDIPFILYWIVAIRLFRSIIMDFIATPIGKSLGLTEGKTLARFIDQSWTFLYSLGSTSLGFYVMYVDKINVFDMPTYLDAYPVSTMPKIMKWYILVQLAYWFQTLLGVNLEVKRKDFWPTVTHHVVTIGLVGSFYILQLHQYFVLSLVVCDIGDFILPLSKLFTYLKMTKAANVTFLIFAVVWVLTRHGILLWVTWSSFWESANHIPYGWRPLEGYTFSKYIIWSERFLVTILHALLIMWAYFIWKIVSNIVNGDGAGDVRSEPDQDIDDRPKEKASDEKDWSKQKQAWIDEGSDIKEAKNDMRK